MSEQQTNISAKLVQRCLKGDAEAQRVVYESLFKEFYPVAYRYMQNKEDAFDLLQDSLVKVFSNPGSFSALGSFKGWVRRTVVNSCIDELRKRKKVFIGIDTDMEDRLETEEEDKTAWDLALLKDADRVMEAVASLPEKSRQVFCLYAIEDYKHHEIAEMLDISVGTSKSNYSRAKRLLREALEKELFKE